MHKLVKRAASAFATILAVVSISFEKPTKAQPRDPSQSPGYKAPTAEEILEKQAEYFAQLTSYLGAIHRPRYIYVQKGGRGCGGRPAGDSPVYCLVDGNIYLTKEFMETTYKEYGPAAIAYVFAHEYAHYLQAPLATYYAQLGLIGELRANYFMPEPYHELQADCLASGLLAGGSSGIAKTPSYMMEYLALTPSSLQRARNLALTLGGGHLHGTGEQREASFHLGVTQGMKACMVKLGLLGYREGIETVYRPNPSYSVLTSSISPSPRHELLRYGEESIPTKALIAETPEALYYFTGNPVEAGNAHIVRLSWGKDWGPAFPSGWKGEEVQFTLTSFDKASGVTTNRSIRHSCNQPEFVDTLKASTTAYRSPDQLYAFARMLCN